MISGSVTVVGFSKQCNVPVVFETCNTVRYPDH